MLHNKLATPELIADQQLRNQIRFDAAKAAMGSDWLLHPSNKITKKHLTKRVSK